LIFPYTEDQLADQKAIAEVIAQAKQIAKRYKDLTGRPLGITGEIAEYEAVRLLGLKLANVRQAGYDAEDAKNQKFQIKGRLLPAGASRGQKLGAVQLKHTWDFMLLVILNDDFEPISIHESAQSDIVKALQKGSSNVRKRGQLSVNEFKGVSQQVWPSKS
jgi:hypothetical protein